MNSFTLTNPSGLWWLAAVAAVALLYLFYRRHRPQQVTGLFLWGVPNRESAGGRKVENPLLGRRFLFDMLAAVLLGLTLAGPAWRTGRDLPLVLVMDNSFSMRARGSDGEARTLGEELIAAASRKGVESAVVLAGDTPRVLRAPGVATRGETVELLRSYRPAAESADIVAAVLLARKLYGEPLDIHVVTNREDGAVPQASSTHILAGRGGNLSLERAWREAAAPTRDRLTASVFNHGDQAVLADFVVEVGAGASTEGAYRESLRLEPRSRRLVEVSLSLVRDEILAIRLLADPAHDVIGDDSTAFLPPLLERRANYLVEGLNPQATRYFELALKAAGCLPAPWNVENAPPPDILISGNAGARGRAVTLEIPPATEPGVYVPPFVVDTANPLCRDLSLSTVPWVAANANVPDDGVQSLVLAGDMPLYWRSGDGVLHLNLIVERCPIVNDAAWPVMMANLASSALDMLPGLNVNTYRPGDVLRYRPEPGRGRSGLSFTRDGTVVLAFSRREAALPREPGLYLLKDDAGDLGPVSVLPQFGAASDASALSDRRETVVHRGTAGEGEGNVDLTWLALAAGLLFLGLNWRSTTKGGG